MQAAPPVQSPLASFTPPVKQDLQEHMTRTYFTVRIAMVVIGFLLPPALILGGLLLDTPPGVRPSMSDYYNSNSPIVRDVFVGALIVVGALLILYRGFSTAEDRALNLAGTFAVGTALFPTGNPAHGWFAVLLFLCIAYVCWFRASDTLALIGDETLRRRYRSIYKSLALLMALLPVAAAILANVLFRSSLVLAVEWVAIWVFGSYWAVKSREFQRTHADQRAAMGRLKVSERLPAGNRMKQALGGAFGDKAVVEMTG